MSTAKVLAGVLAGFAAGAVLGLLYAPERGSAMRSRLMKRGEDLAGSLQDTLSDSISGFRERFMGDGEDELEEVASRTSKSKRHTGEGSHRHAHRSNHNHHGRGHHSKHQR